MRISDWSSDVCSSDLAVHPAQAVQQLGVNRLHFGAHRRRLQRPIHQLLALGKSALAHVAERKPCHGGSVPTIAVQSALEQPDRTLQAPGFVLLARGGHQLGDVALPALAPLPSPGAALRLARGVLGVRCWLLIAHAILLNRLKEWRGSAAPDSPGGDSCQVKRSFRSEEHTSELQSLMRISYAVFCLKK